MVFCSMRQMRLLMHSLAPGPLKFSSPISRTGSGDFHFKCVSVSILWGGRTDRLKNCIVAVHRFSAGIVRGSSKCYRNIALPVQFHLCRHQAVQWPTQTECVYYRVFRDTPARLTESLQPYPTATGTRYRPSASWYSERNR
jgi:hypothetical protein